MSADVSVKVLLLQWQTRRTACFDENHVLISSVHTRLCVCHQYVIEKRKLGGCVSGCREVVMQPSDNILHADVACLFVVEGL